MNLYQIDYTTQYSFLEASIILIFWIVCLISIVGLFGTTVTLYRYFKPTLKELWEWTKERREDGTTES